MVIFETRAPDSPCCMLIRDMQLREDGASSFIKIPATSGERSDNRKQVELYPNGRARWGRLLLAEKEIVAQSFRHPRH